MSYRFHALLLAISSSVAISGCKPAEKEQAWTAAGGPSAFAGLPTAEVKGTLQGRMGSSYWSLGGAAGSSVSGSMSLLFGIGKDQVRCKADDHTVIEDPQNTHDEIEIRVPNKLGTYKKSTAPASSHVLQHRRNNGAPGANVADWTVTLSAISATRIAGSASITFASPDAGTVAGTFDIQNCGEYVPH